MQTFTLGSGASVTLATMTDRDNTLLAACAEIVVLEQGGADGEHASRIAELRASIAATPAHTDEGRRAQVEALIARDNLVGGVRAAAVALDTPIAAIGRRHDEAEDGMWACLEQACDYPATTLSDAAFQTYAAGCFVDDLIDTTAGDDGVDVRASCERIRRASTSALRVIAAHLADADAPGLKHAAFSISQRWKGELPPVVLATLPPQSARLHGDAAIVSAAASHIDLELGFLRRFCGPDAIEDDRERDVADEASGRVEKQEPFAETIATRRAVTPAGWRAKALVALTRGPELLTPHDFTGEVVASLLVDLVGDYSPIAVAEGKVAPARLGDAVPHPDAALLALSERYADAMHGWRAIIEAGEETIEGDDIAMAKADPLWQEMRAMLPGLVELRATTSDGLAARARLLHVVNGDGSSSWSSEDGNRAGVMLEALVRDAGALPAPGAAA